MSKSDSSVDSYSIDEIHSLQTVGQYKELLLGCMCMHTCVCMCVFMYLCACVCLSVYACLSACVCLCVCVSVCVCVCV